MQIILPKKKSEENSVEHDIDSLVIIGSNGSGKTRFGAEIEKKHDLQTHRISAQKSLVFPKSVNLTSIEKAESDLHYGYYQENLTDRIKVSHKGSQRWGGKRATHPLSDYDKLVVLLFSQNADQAVKFKDGLLTEKPITNIDIVKRIWENALPHRKLEIGSADIQVYPTDSIEKKYNASDMSDGERVIFYLIGEVISAPKNSIIIIDEPEIHIHESLVSKLFDAIEESRRDCCFVYLTHDINFAVSRNTAKKIWLKSYEEDFGVATWDYDFLVEKNPLPEELYLDILGSRKPVLFIEGEISSLDNKIYSLLFGDEYTIKPVGSCASVIQNTKAFRGEKSFHHIESYGLIDRDRKGDAEVTASIAKGIWVLNFSEIDNFLISEPVIRSIASHLGKDEDTVFEEAKDAVLNYLKNNKPKQINLHFKDILNKVTQEKFSNINVNNVDVLSDVKSLISGLSLDTLYQEISDEIDQIISMNSYEEVLKKVNEKSLWHHSKLSQNLGINYDAFVVLVLKKIKEDIGLRDILISYISK